MAPTLHSPVMLKTQVLVLLFADDLTADTVISIGLQRAMNYMYTGVLQRMEPEDKCREDKGSSI
jgi:hypothetical protein